MGSPYAPGTRTIRMCSFDGRSWTDTGIIPMDKVGGKVPQSMGTVERRQPQPREVG